MYKFNTFGFFVVVSTQIKNVCGCAAAINSLYYATFGLS